MGIPLGSLKGGLAPGTINHGLAIFIVCSIVEAPQAGPPLF